MNQETREEILAKLTPEQRQEFDEAQAIISQISDILLAYKPKSGFAAMATLMLSICKVAPHESVKLFHEEISAIAERKGFAKQIAKVFTDIQKGRVS